MKAVVYLWMRLRYQCIKMSFTNLLTTVVEQVSSSPTASTHCVLQSMMVSKSIGNPGKVEVDRRYPRSAP